MLYEVITPHKWFGFFGFVFIFTLLVVSAKLFSFSLQKQYRITSYNVCYTKLLRVNKVHALEGAQGRMTHPDTAAIKALVALDPVVADLQVIGITIDDDAAAGVGPDDGETVNPGATVSILAETAGAAGRGQDQHPGPFLGEQGDGFRRAGADFLPWQRNNFV